MTNVILDLEHKTNQRRSRKNDDARWGETVIRCSTVPDARRRCRQAPAPATPPPFPLPAPNHPVRSGSSPTGRGDHGAQIRRGEHHGPLARRHRTSISAVRAYPSTASSRHRRPAMEIRCGMVVGIDVSNRRKERERRAVSCVWFTYGRNKRVGKYFFANVLLL